MPENIAPLPDFTRWPSFPFEGDMRVKQLAAPVAVEPPRSGEDATDCIACSTPDDAYVWVSERWRVRAMDRPTGLPMVLILECRSHLDLGDLPNLLAAELGVMTVRLERAIRSLDGVARVHVNRWGDGSAHLHMWFLARPYGRLQLRGTFLSLWDDILPVIPEMQWRENLALVAAWLAEFGGQANAEPAHIQWESPSTIAYAAPEANESEPEPDDIRRPATLSDVEAAESYSAPHPTIVTERGTDESNAREGSAGKGSASEARVQEGRAGESSAIDGSAREANASEGSASRSSASEDIAREANASEGSAGRSGASESSASDNGVSESSESPGITA